MSNYINDNNINNFSCLKASNINIISTKDLVIDLDSIYSAGDMLISSNNGNISLNCAIKVDGTLTIEADSLEVSGVISASEIDFQ